jgi:hypothetical protein
MEMKEHMTEKQAIKNVRHFTLQISELMLEVALITF